MARIRRDMGGNANVVYSSGAGRIEAGDIVHASGKLIYDSLKTARESERRLYFD